MITIRIDSKAKGAYKKIITLAKKDNVFKACGNPDDMWIMLKFKDNIEFTSWLENTK